LNTFEYLFAAASSEYCSFSFQSALKHLIGCL